MRSSEPPRFATLVLRRLGPRNEPLIGDLLEEYRSGRSRWWYWRQSVTAIAVGAVSEIRGDKLLVVRAVAMGTGIQVLIDMPLTTMWTYWLREWILGLSRDVWTGSTNASLHWFHMLSWFPGWVCVGWLLAKLNRERQGTVALTFAVFALLASAPGLVSLASDTLDHARFLNQLEIRAVGTAMMVVGVLVGALMSVPVAETQELIIDSTEGKRLR